VGKKNKTATKKTVDWRGKPTKDLGEYQEENGGREGKTKVRGKREKSMCVWCAKWLGGGGLSKRKKWLGKKKGEGGPKRARRSAGCWETVLIARRLFGVWTDQRG